MSDIDTWINRHRKNEPEPQPEPIITSFNPFRQTGSVTMNTGARTFTIDPGTDVTTTATFDGQHWIIEENGVPLRANVGIQLGQRPDRLIFYDEHGRPLN